jgi:hypothetical protein
MSGCTVDRSSGTGIEVTEGASGAIVDTLMSNCTIGLDASGDFTTLAIAGSSFFANDLGLSFDSGKHVFINDTLFVSNGVPISVLSGNLSLFDCAIEKAQVSVDRPGDEVEIGYTLTVSVIDEEDDGVPFIMNLTRGTGSDAVTTRYDIGGAQSFTFKKGLVSYTVLSDSIDQKYLPTTVAIQHEQGMETPISFDHVMTREIVVTMFAPPSITTSAKNQLSAIEDKGLKDGPQDIRSWFTDSPRDLPNLTFTTSVISGRIEPRMTGSILEISSEKDWNGMGEIRITATDPHGKSQTHILKISVVQVNDLPIAKNPMILVNGQIVEPLKATTGDNLTAQWDWYDVDGDLQPKAKRVIWYLNGTRATSYDGIPTVMKVRAGQYWNFTIYPADDYSFASGKYGAPVNSPGIMVGNIPPTFSSVSLTPSAPTTDEDLKAIPGTWSDPDSAKVYFHYEWQRRNAGSGPWITLYAADSPVLPASYYSKGDVIGVKAWITDGYSESEVRSATVTIADSAPSVVSANLLPEVINEKTPYIRIIDVVTADPDNDQVTLNYVWTISGEVVDSGVDTLYRSKWSNLEHVNVSVSIIPYDTESKEGSPFVLDILYKPTDTDGDTLFDDANGNGINDEGDDTDDDNDGFLDEWERALSKDPSDPLSFPQDWDRDGMPDGDPDPQNAQPWMDPDDDNDGVRDTLDNYPLNPTLPGDLDGDGMGDDIDTDIDGDGVLNEDDQDPRNSKIGKKDTGLDLSMLEIILLIILVLIVIAIAATGYSVYTGQLKLPTNAPPEVVYEKEGIAPERMRRDVALDALEDVDLEDMMVCSECGEVVKREEETCPNCGSLFSEETETFSLEEDLKDGEE